MQHFHLTIPTVHDIIAVQMENSMQTFYLMFSEKENRAIVDTEKYPGAEVQKEVLAKSWLDAKNKFGFELTLKQEIMLEEQNGKSD